MSIELTSVQYEILFGVVPNFDNELQFERALLTWSKEHPDERLRTHWRHVPNRRKYVVYRQDLPPSLADILADCEKFGMRFGPKSNVRLNSSGKPTISMTLGDAVRGS